MRREILRESLCKSLLQDIGNDRNENILKIFQSTENASYPLALSERLQQIVASLHDFQLLDSLSFNPAPCFDWPCEV